jgi:prohibitin 1
MVFADSVVGSALYNVNGGHRAVILDCFTGIKKNVSNEGTHFLVPCVQKPIIFDIRSRPRSVTVMTGSKGMSCVYLLGRSYSIDKNLI